MHESARGREKLGSPTRTYLLRCEGHLGAAGACEGFVGGVAVRTKGGRTASARRRYVRYLVRR